jgi:hypothetical protein
MKGPNTSCQLHVNFSSLNTSFIIKYLTKIFLSSNSACLVEETSKYFFYFLLKCVNIETILLLQNNICLQMFLYGKCKAKLCPPGQYFMIILSWNFVLSMTFCPLFGQHNVMLWTIYHSENVS